MNIRAPLQIYTLSIFSKPLKMLLEKLYLRYRMEPRRVAHPIRAGGGGGLLYHKILNKSLKVKDLFVFTHTISVRKKLQCLPSIWHLIPQSLPLYKSSIFRRNYK